MIKKAIEEAIKARELAYAPYSKFKVGAAILFKNDEVIHGCNVENISYGLSNCAERTALFSMIASNKNKNDVKCMAIVGQNSDPISPCGACRQVLVELLNPDTLVILANLKGEYVTYKVSDFLPYSFNKIENEI